MGVSAQHIADSEVFNEHNSSAMSDETHQVENSNIERVERDKAAHENIIHSSERSESNVYMKIPLKE